MYKRNKHSTVKQNAEDAWDFLNVIYETAYDPGFWPLALEGIKVELDSFEAQNTLENINILPIASNNILNSQRSNSKGLTDQQNSSFIRHFDKNQKDPEPFNFSMVTASEMELITKLQPHFKRALELNRHYQALQEKSDITTTLLDRLPLGIIFTDNFGKVITQNSFAETLIQKDFGLTINKGIIQATNNKFSKKLLMHIGKAHENPDSNKDAAIISLQIPQTSDHASLSILITPHMLPDTSAQQQGVVLFIVSANTEFAINENALSSLFGLSVTEAIIAKHIASGKTLAQYSDIYGVTHHTVRSQLKSIFKKTCTHSQSELSSRVLTSPAIFVTQQKHTKTQQTKTNKKETFHNFPDNKQFIELPDGRTLCYADVGDKEGLPVVICHGYYGCRLERYPDDSIVTELGIRLIVPDRPGFGLSTAMQSQQGIEWCQDFEFLLNHLGIDKTHILSTSSGSYFALSCAHEKSERLSGLTLVNSLAPFESVKEFNGMIPHEKISFAMARHTPALYKRFVELCVLGLSKNADWYFNSVKKYGGNQDNITLSDNSLTSFLKHKALTALKHSHQGVIQETLILVKPWKIDLTKINTHVELYHAGEQVAVPSSMSKRLDSLLPDSSFHYLLDQGTYCFYTKWKSLLLSIKNSEKLLKNNNDKRNTCYL
ncbi:MAG: alpha/beta fold hydrolase [Thiohalomonadales bacterium]